jgi:hypothetical protein
MCDYQDSGMLQSYGSTHHTALSHITQWRAIRDADDDKITMPYSTKKMTFKQTKLSIERSCIGICGVGVRTNEYDDGLLVSIYIPKPDYASITIEHLSIYGGL